MDTLATMVIVSPQVVVVFHMAIHGLKMVVTNYLLTGKALQTVVDPGYSRQLRWSKLEKTTCLNRKYIFKRSMFQQPLFMFLIFCWSLDILYLSAKK